MHFSMAQLLFPIVFFTCTICSTPLVSQSNAQEKSEQALMALENLILSNDYSKIENYLKDYVALSDKKSEDWHEKLKDIIVKMHDLDGDVGVSQEGSALILNMANRNKEQAVKLLFDQTTGKIVDLILMQPPEKLILTLDNLNETFDQLENDGLSGIIFVKMNNEIVMERAFGMSDRISGQKNTINTIFGTGSRPIDYTVAAILLLDQEGKLSVDDPIIRHIKSVPADKTSMTIKHLMTGQSGLPDFFDNEQDWDADLAWVDRETAIRRMMAQTLLFEPGKGRSHSHGAFGLLAAIVELSSGQSYYSFIREKFLDPAGMTRTGEYGEIKGLTQEDFAAGWGPQKVGIPNIPPNWGPTSWLIKGSGGMYSTLGDLKKFYRFVRSSPVFDEKHRQHFLGATANLDGSMRGFELFSLYESPGNEVYLFLNEFKDTQEIRHVMKALERMVVQGN